ncbi:hypothetical protein DFJ58DRAFT_861752 [Suillus subalutaceus]|uniref:uncharacterized protein n=1 Tax=Suillus subalutaceus TaxID=48586 RepID=UPI001B86C989|nr:uncharacterized protein DFJ58DRAFT_861752 [Suillus subalutaceus]KAG1838184.1 hypothetical protein DFJ58DRAFT_861752 [Suillus subalutaceus]
MAPSYHTTNAFVIRPLEVSLKQLHQAHQHLVHMRSCFLWWMLQFIAYPWVFQARSFILGKSSASLSFFDLRATLKDVGLSYLSAFKSDTQPSLLAVFIVHVLLLKSISVQDRARRLELIKPDLSVLAPRLFAFERIFNPWKIMNTANSFISAISGYAVSLGPLTGIMFTITSQGIAVSNSRISSSHRLEATIGVQCLNEQSFTIAGFWHGLNWRAPIAWVLGVWASLPGFCASVTPASMIVSNAWVYYNMSITSRGPSPGIGEVDDSDVFETFKEFRDPKDGEGEKEEPDHLNKFPTYIASLEHP